MLTDTLKIIETELLERWDFQLSLLLFQEVGKMNSFQETFMND